MKTWQDVPTEYLAHYVPWVLAPERQYKRIRELVTTVGYLDQKLARVGIQAVLGDLRTDRGLAPTPKDAEDLAAVEAALNQAAQVLKRAPEQLCAQMLAGVTHAGTGDVARLLDEAAAWRRTTWWRPSGAIRTYLASFGPVQGLVDAVAVTSPDHSCAG
jgi:hypothetical protein